MAVRDRNRNDLSQAKVSCHGPHVFLFFNPTTVHSLCLFTTEDHSCISSLICLYFFLHFRLPGSSDHHFDSLKPLFKGPRDTLKIGNLQYTMFNISMSFWGWVKHLSLETDNGRTILSILSTVSKTFLTMPQVIVLGLLFSSGFAAHIFF